MAAQIRISPEQMRTRAASYTAQADRVNEVISDMDQLLKILQSEWEGAASESYAVRYEELRPGFVKAEELIREIASSLNTTAQVLEETDQSIASGFRGGV